MKEGNNSTRNMMCSWYTWTLNLGFPEANVDKEAFFKLNFYHLISKYPFPGTKSQKGHAIKST